MNAIEVHGVSKTYRIPHERHTTLAERVLSAFRPVPVEVLQAVNDVTLEVPAGRFVGLIGANGSGKSTLLKVMAGLLIADEGRVVVNGTLAPLLELGLGFHNELTVRENVELYGAVLGYPRAQLQRRTDEAIAFAELERFRDAKLKSLSSGMLVRLAFATALRADADILLLDEVLAVGDARFQRKCMDVFTGLKEARKTIVLVSHDVGAVQRFCDRVFWLDKGRLAMSGDATEVVQTYLAMMTTPLDPVQIADEAESEHRHGDRRVRFVGARLESEDGQPLAQAVAGSRVVLRLEAVAHGTCVKPVFGFVVWRAGQIVYSTNTLLLDVDTGTLTSGDRCTVEISFAVALVNGSYSLHIAAADAADGAIHDWVNHALPLVVHGGRSAEGIADLDARVRYVEPMKAPATRAVPTR
jgi:ABC-type polysaccharide/polyol phosphate transport system ATPase subunit